MAHATTILTLCSVFPVVTAAVLVMRLYVRIYILKSFGKDDAVISASTVSIHPIDPFDPTLHQPNASPQLCCFAYAGLCMGQSSWGLGLPIELRPPEDLDQLLKINFAGRPFYMLGVLGFKVALCLTYLRILHGSPNRFYKFLIKAVMVAAIVGHLAGTLILLIQCIPLQKSWIKEHEGTCMPDIPTFYGLAAVTVLFDIIIIPLPIPALLKLRISKAKRNVLISVFLLGLFTTGCSIARMYQISVIQKTGNTTMLIVWGVIELNVGIILTCIPTLGPLFPGLVGGSSNARSPRAVRLQVLKPRAGNPATPRAISLNPDFANPHDDAEILLATDMRVNMDGMERGISAKR
ncbi:MAG: hypothetical protein Q9208_000607 [Pyrenodesmia sp. 3 TL-2023]